MILRSDAIERTIGYGRALAKLLENDDVVVLCGDLGAGKTHLTKGIAEGLGVSSDITSPTFNIMRQYECDGDKVLCHWDLYRLDEIEQLDDVDFYGMLESGCITVIEWGDRFPEALPDDYLKISISLDSATERTLELEGIGPRGIALAQGLASMFAGVE
ncbi:MAG: tRNA (adenosine(37)-N6)-threonylcarbamoyltransferase complex ATPase subunit type 1 TsaE [Coriobacteriales bacterium]|nr:tRNA (adenosine(37)-N6)-threonylcarbamoyltransferase complex ATPase subunit type 1 TsaE [Coriobacteriales bacterium]